MKVYWQHVLLNPLDNTQCLHRTDKCRVFAGWLWLLWLFVEFYWRKSLTSLSLLLLQKPAYPANLNKIVCKMENRRACCFYFEGCCFQIRWKYYAASLCSFYLTFYVAFRKSQSGLTPLFYWYGYSGQDRLNQIWDILCQSQCILRIIYFWLWSKTCYQRNGTRMVCVVE